MEDNDHNLIATPPVPTPEKPKRLSPSNIIMVVFLALLLVAAFSQSVALSGLLFLPTIIMGVIAGITVYNMIMGSVMQRGPTVRFFTGIVALFVAFIIFCISFFAALAGWARNSPPVEGD